MAGVVRRYVGQSHHRVSVAGVERRLPLVMIRPGVYIASNAELILGDTEFITKVAESLAGKIRKFEVDVVLTAEAKSIALAYELSKQLGSPRFVVARKTKKSYMGGYFSQKVKSITTASDQRLLLANQELGLLSGRRVCLLDDVVSTGGTFAALAALAAKAGGTVVCRAAIWKEGPWYRKHDVTYLGLLPIFVEPGVDPLGEE